MANVLKDAIATDIDVKCATTPPPLLVHANRQCYRDRLDWDSKLYERLLFGKRFVTLVRL